MHQFTRLKKRLTECGKSITFSYYLSINIFKSPITNRRLTNWAATAFGNELRNHIKLIVVDMNTGSSHQMY